MALENNLQTFIEQIGKSGIAKKDRYVIEISGPGGSLFPPTINMMCESISFPGQNIRSVPDTLRFGPAREHGQGITFGPFTAQFICSSDMREKKFFEFWQSTIINSRWEPNYYDNYKGSLLITQLGEMDQSMYAIKVIEAYPKTIMPQDMGYAQNNAYHTLGIEFTYRYWNPQIIEAPTQVDTFDHAERHNRGEFWRMRMPAKNDPDFPQSNAFTGGRGLTQFRSVDPFNTWQTRRGQGRFQGEGDTIPFRVYGGQGNRGSSAESQAGKGENRGQGGAGGPDAA